MSTTNEIPQFRETLKDLREKMLRMLKMCEGRDFKQGDALEILNDSLINLIDIKSLNRQIQGEVESIKDFLNNEKEKVEEKNLQLQNNMYQKENIVSQINSCINFPTKEMNKIQMPSKYEVLEHYKEKSLHKTDEEIKLMDYLECELEFRKKLNEKVNKSLKEKEGNISKLKDFEKFYSDLPKYLENLENSTLKSQNYLNLNFNEKNKNLNLSGKLPPPLFILYNLLQCFSDDTIESELNIKGREGKVDEFYSKYASFFDCYLKRNLNSDNVNEENDEGDNRQREEGEHSEGEIEDEEAFEKKSANKKKKKKRKIFFNESLNYGKAANTHNALSEDEAEFKKIVGKLANKEERLSKFPLHVEFIIKKNKSDSNENEENNKFYPMTFNFYFIPVVNLISVEIANSSQLNSNTKIINLVSNEESTISMNLNTSQILFNVFQPPSTLLNLIKNKIEAILGECCTDFGKTEKVFDFLQILTNNSLYNSKGLKDFCMLYFNYKNKKNKSLLNISVENSVLENPLNSFDMEPNQLNFLSSYFDNTSSINIDNFITRVKDRLNYLPLLLSQVDYLLKYFSLKEEILNEFRNEKKFQIVKEKTKITNVRRIAKFDFYSKQEEVFNSSNDTVKFSSFFINESSEKIYEKISSSKNFDVEAIYLCLEFERKNYKINAYAEVRYDFPNQAPRFILTMESSKGNGLNIPGELMEFVNKENNLDDFKAENCGFSNILREIENEVNEYCLEDVIRNEKLIGLVFSYQVRTIQMCIDLFADKDNSKYHAYFAADNISSKRKKRPFLFNDVNSSFHN